MDSIRIEVATKRILLVEHVSDWVDIESEVIGGLEGTLLTTANSVEGAISLLEREKYDLVLTDLHFPTGLHGDRLIAYILEHSPETQVGIASGTLSDTIRDRLLSQEYGLLFIEKDDFDIRPLFAKEKLARFLVHEPHYQARDGEAINALLAEAVGLNDIPAIFQAIDALKPQLGKLSRYINGLEMDPTLKSRLVELVQPDALYHCDLGTSYSNLHDYKRPFKTAVDEVRSLSEQNPEYISLYRHMSIMLTSIVGILESTVGIGKLNIKQIWDREVAGLENLYPGVTFEIESDQPSDSAQDNSQDPSRFLVDSRLRETLRILLSNAAEAYDGHTGEKKVTLNARLGSHGDEGLYLNIRNRGEPIPQELRRGKSFDLSKLKTTKPSYGSGFGVLRALELEEKVGYELWFMYKEEQTNATIRLESDCYEIMSPIEKEQYGGTVLIYDHSRTFSHLEDAKDALGFSIHYVTSQHELKEIASDPKKAQAYFSMVMHGPAIMLFTASQIEESNPNMGLIFCSGNSRTKDKAGDMFPDAEIYDHMPVEQELSRILLEHKARYDAQS